jgi:molybdopterin synthase sulfur carrier subunit
VKTGSRGRKRTERTKKTQRTKRTSENENDNGNENDNENEMKTVTARTTLQVRVSYFAVLRERRGATQETLATDAATPRELYERLRAQYQFPLTVRQARVAINDAFADWDAALGEGDRVAFIPPVAGG